MANTLLAEIEKFLTTPEAYGLAGNVEIEKIETHASIIFLGPIHAYKLKKPVDFGFLDFTTPEKRRVACMRELALNRRTAPEIYHAVVPLRRGAHGIVLGGESGEIIDWLVEMQRFPADGLFARLADEGRLPLGVVEVLAADVARFHRVAEVRRDQGGAEAFARIVAGNDENLRDHVGSIFDVADIQHLREASDLLIERHKALLDGRRADGFVRHCHGDLHLGNVTLIGEKPVIFDCIEFSDEFACIDILYDLAFLLMDIAFREASAPHLRGFANRTLNVYLDHAAQDEIAATIDGLALMPLFLATRAAVRAKVTAIAADTAEKRDEARAYLRFALDALSTAPACMIAVSGLSGTGKSTLAMRLAPHLGLIGGVHLRSDIIRKRLFGVAALDRLPEAAYSLEATGRVYDEMLMLAERVVGAGLTAVLDAVFASPAERDTAEYLAAKLGVPFHGLWLEAPQRTLEERVASRHARALDPSDADVEVLRRQLGYDLGEMRWQRIDASSGPAETLALALKRLAIPAI